MILILIVGVFFAAPFAIGLVLIFISSKGVYAVRECSCGYDLRRLPPSSLRCPECGAKKGHVTIDNPRLFKVGLIVLLFPVALALSAMGLVLLWAIFQAI